MRVYEHFEQNHAIKPHHTSFLKPVCLLNYELQGLVMAHLDE